MSSSQMQLMFHSDVFSVWSVSSVQYEGCALCTGFLGPAVQPLDLSLVKARLSLSRVESEQQ